MYKRIESLKINVKDVYIIYFLKKTLYVKIFINKYIRGKGMNIFSILAKKRDGKELTKEEIDFFIKGICSGDIADYQASAMLMAMYINGLNDKELVNLTIAMKNSGDVADLSSIEGIKVDKHSTGGIGDKTTLIIAPMLASMGLKVAKMSGRGLGHTGGTVDKLESITGYNTALSPKQFINNVKKIGICLTGQSGNFAPADKILYALRDTTATIDNIPLIASSIMSKKLACGNDCLILDVKVGSGAFCKTLKEGMKLAKYMVKIGNGSGIKTMALITEMNNPLGKNIGNSLEVIEAVEVLKNGGPSDLRNVSIDLVANLYSMATGVSLSEATKKAVSVLEDGSALEKFKEVVKLQGGDVELINDTNKFEKAKYSFKFTAENEGYISSFNCQTIGETAVTLGAGRVKKEDKYTNKKNIKDVALNQFGKAVGISNKKVKPLKEVLAVVK